MNQRDLFITLKEETSNQHRAIEKEIDLLSSSLTRESYVKHLTKRYGFQRPLEAHLLSFRSIASSLSLGERMKSHLLEKDLLVFGLSESQIHALPYCPTTPEVRNISRLVGILYVLEGSTLGGRVICNHVQSTLFLKEQELNFFNGYGAETGRKWLEFKKQAHVLIPSHQIPQSVAAAIETFESLRVWMSDEP